MGLFGKQPGVEVVREMCDERGVRHCPRDPLDVRCGRHARITGRDAGPDMLVR